MWLVVVALVYLSPTLVHGTKLGPYDILSQFGLGSLPGVRPHNAVASDQIQQMAPWSTLAWEQVHHGHLPLWDPYNALGLPLAFNFQSAPFSLPALVSYLVPVRFAYTLITFLKIVIAGTGVLVLARTLKLGALAGALAGTVFELSGAFTTWLGWPQAGVFCWLGWILAASVLLVRGTNTRRDAPFLAMVLAWSILGGHPESVGITVLTTGIVVLVLLVVQFRSDRSLDSTLRAIARFAVGIGAGIALAAPELLPAAQVAAQSVHRSLTGYGGMPTSRIVNLTFAGFYGLPTVNGHYFDETVSYYDSAAYVGLVALVLAALAVICWWRKSEVIGLTVAGIVLATIAYVPSVAHWLLTLPLMKLVLWDRDLIPLDLVLAILAGTGLQAVLDGTNNRVIRRCFTAIGALSVCIITVLGLRQLMSNLPAADAAVRSRSFIAPSIEAAILVGVALALSVAIKRTTHDLLHSKSTEVSARWAMAIGLLLVGSETVFLVTAAPRIWSSSQSFFATTPAEVELQRLVGSSRIGFAECPSVSQMPSLGILPEANSAYGISELSAYDPIVPKSYFDSVPLKESGTPSAFSFGQFCPSVTTAAIGRAYGVSYVLAAPGASPPPGMTFVATIGGEDLYRVPGGALVTVVPGSSPTGDEAVGAVIPVSDPNPATVHFRVNVTQTSTIYIHITDLPGWRATFNGRPLPLRPAPGTTLEAHIGPGSGEITLTYRPAAFVLGLLIAGAAILALATYCTFPWLMGRVRTRHELEDPSPAPETAG